MSYIEKIKLLPNVDIERILEFKRIIESEVGEDSDGYILSDKLENTSLNRQKILSVFKKFEGLEQYSRFRLVFKRLSFFDYKDVLILLYWYSYFLYQQNKVSKEILVKGYQSIQDFNVKDKETNKVYGIDNVYDLIKLEEDDKLKFEKSHVEFTDYEKDGQTYSYWDLKVDENNRYDIVINGFEFKDKDEYISYENVYVRDFLEGIRETTKDNRELIIIIILGLKILKGTIINGYGYYRYYDARQINKTIDELRLNLSDSQHSNWVDTLMEDNKILGWWD